MVSESPTTDPAYATCEVCSLTHPGRFTAGKGRRLPTRHSSVRAAVCITGQRAAFSAPRANGFDNTAASFCPRPLALRAPWTASRIRTKARTPSPRPQPFHAVESSAIPFRLREVRQHPPAPSVLVAPPAPLRDPELAQHVLRQPPVFRREPLKPRAIRRHQPTNRAATPSVIGHGRILRCPFLGGDDLL